VAVSEHFPLAVLQPKKLKTFNFRLVYLISSKSVGQKCFGILYDTLLISIQVTTAATTTHMPRTVTRPSRFTANNGVRAMWEI